MLRANWVACCAVVALAFPYYPTIAVAQNGPFGRDGGDSNPFGLAGPEPEPTLAIDPAPAEEIALPAMRGAAAADDLCRCVGDNSTAPTVVNIRNVLRQPLRESGIEYAEQPLEEVVAELQSQYDIPIKLDTTALDDLGVQPDQVVTIRLHDISLSRTRLRLMLKELGLTYIVQNEVLLITTPDEAEQQLLSCVYDVRDLHELTKVGGLKRLIDTIASCAATETWAVNGGGEAEIRPLEPGLLVISQTQAIHEEVRDLLDTIRQVYARHVPPAAAANAAAGFVAPAIENPGDVVTRSYLLQINQPADAKALSAQIRELITSSLPDEQWTGRLDDNEPVVLTVLPDRVVLRHRQAVQQQVQSLLEDSGIAVPAGGGFGGGRGEFGRGGGFGGGGRGEGGGFFNPRPAENQ